ncbi:MAG: hypothetical protein HQK50_18310, partial [Oligoflexia bacterium]|nr:hypothetical protein [Oligoflexia bacterium]
MSCHDYNYEYDCFSSKIKKIIDAGYKRDIQGKIKTSFVILKTFGHKRMREAFNHSLLQAPRDPDDLSPERRSRVDVWRYQYKHPHSGAIITDSHPIATRKEFWKCSFEARIIAVTLFGNNKKYLQGSLDFIQSISETKAASGLLEKKLWGYESFSFRFYVAKRRPENAFIGAMNNTTSDAFIAQLLNQGCEIAYVDNHLPQVGRDAAFWRFMVLDEQMPKGEKIRYLLREVDHKVTDAELFT